MGPPRFPFWRRGGAGASSKKSSGGGKSGEDDDGAAAAAVGGGGNASRGFAAFYRALPPAPGVVRFFARDQVSD